MDVREKLVELLRDVQYLGGLEEKIAGHLIANDVTVQEWISVNDELPKKITNKDGIIIRPDGVHELDPCEYETIEIHRNVTVEILRCKNCGNTEILWSRQKNTEDEYVGDENG